METKRIFTTKEAAAYLGISYSYLRVIRMTGQIKDRLAPPPHIYIGHALRYVKEDLDRWIDEQPRVCRDAAEPAWEVAL